MITENEQKFIKQVISEFDSTPNKKITEVLDILRRDFDDSKKIIERVSEHMKITETVYNELLVKYKNRTNS
jgi:hypothetical protein